MNGGTQFLQKSGLSYWKLAIWKGANGAVIVALGSVVAALANEDWSQMDGQAKFLFIAGVSLSVLKSLDMLLDQTIARLTQAAHLQPPQAPPAIASMQDLQKPTDQPKT